MQGWESHPPSPAYETGQSTGSPCVWKMKPWSACDDSTYPPNLWRSDPLSCRAWHTRSMKMARRVGIAPTSAGFGGPCIACLLPPCWLMDCCPTMKGHRGGHATVSGFPRTHATYSSPPALCALSWLVTEFVTNQKRTNTAATHGMRFSSSLASHPQVVSRRMFRCLWHTFREAVS